MLVNITLALTMQILSRWKKLFSTISSFYVYDCSTENIGRQDQFHPCFWDLHVRLHRTQCLCRQLLYAVSTRMCNLFWTRSGRRLPYPVWWVFLACTEQNLSVPWILTYSRLETDSAKGYTGWETSGWGSLSRTAPFQFSWGCTRHLVIGDVEKPNNLTEPITGHDGRIEWDMKNVRRWPVHPVLRWFVYAHSNEKCHKWHHFGNVGWVPGDLLIRIWVYCLLRITISLVDEHILHKLTIIQLEELYCRQCGKVAAGGARISSELHRPTHVMVSLFPTRSKIYLWCCSTGSRLVHFGVTLVGRLQ